MKKKMVTCSDEWFFRYSAAVWTLGACTGLCIGIGALPDIPIPGFARAAFALLAALQASGYIAIEWILLNRLRKERDEIERGRNEP